MFADIVAAYYRGVISLYLNEDSSGDDNSIPNTDDGYLFNTRDDEDMPRPLAPPLFSFC
jgi:hypothetical protein